MQLFVVLCTRSLYVGGHFRGATEIAFEQSDNNANRIVGGRESELYAQIYKGNGNRDSTPVECTDSTGSENPNTDPEMIVGDILAFIDNNPAIGEIGRTTDTLVPNFGNQEGGFLDHLVIGATSERTRRLDSDFSIGRPIRLAGTIGFGYRYGPSRYGGDSP